MLLRWGHAHDPRARESPAACVGHATSESPSALRPARSESPRAHPLPSAVASSTAQLPACYVPAGSSLVAISDALDVATALMERWPRLFACVVSAATGLVLREMAGGLPRRCDS